VGVLGQLAVLAAGVDARGELAQEGVAETPAEANAGKPGGIDRDRDMAWARAGAFSRTAPAWPTSVDLFRCRT